jgi:hypothetical protein
MRRLVRDGYKNKGGKERDTVVHLRFRACRSRINF